MWKSVTLRLAEIDPTIEMDVKGGVWFKQDCHMNPGAFLRQLKDKILNMGAEVVYNAVGQKLFLILGGLKLWSALSRYR